MQVKTKPGGIAAVSPGYIRENKPDLNLIMS